MPSCVIILFHLFVYCLLYESYIKINKYTIQAGNIELQMQHLVLLLRLHFLVVADHPTELFPPCQVGTLHKYSLLPR
jgi:hypothetical protein